MVIGLARTPRAPADERTRGVVAPRIRLGAALALAVAIPFVSGIALHERVSLLALTLAYAVATLVLEAVAARHPGFPARLGEALLGVTTIFVVTLLLPELQAVALVLYAVGVVAYTAIGGPKLGVVLTGAAIAAAAVAHWLAPAGDRVDGLLLVFAAALPVLVLVADALSRQQRRRAARLARLHDVLRVVTLTPDLNATLDSIVESVGGALDATGAGILLDESGELVVASASGTASARTLFDRAVVSEPRPGDDDPIARARLRCETVVVADVRDDVRFPEWSLRSRDAPPGFAALVAVPLRLGRDALGVLAAVFSQRGDLGHHDLALLEAYAEQAALVIVRAQAYERERLAATQLAEASQRKDEFLSMVSHELRTPLTAAKGFVDTVLLHWDRLPEARRRELLTRASGNADELARLVGQLLDFALVDTDRVELDPQPLAIRATVDEVRADLEPVLAGHRIEVDVAPQLVVAADRDAFTHVLVNLLTNAVKFSPPGSRVRVLAQAIDDEVVVSVADEGRGVRPGDRERIFERFYQTPDNQDAHRGTGIGLTIARRFVELHGGRIWVGGEPGRGATFSFSLPASLPARMPLTVGTAAPPLAGTPEVSPS